jgi:hypothetical protein
MIVLRLAISRTRLYKLYMAVWRFTMHNFTSVRHYNYDHLLATNYACRLGSRLHVGSEIMRLVGDSTPQSLAPRVTLNSPPSPQLGPGFVQLV